MPDQVHNGRSPWPRRREILAATVGATLYRGREAMAQAAPSRTVGFLTTRSREEARSHTEAYLRGLADLGFVEGRNLTVIYRWADGVSDRLPRMAAELLAMNPAVISAGGDPSALALRAATGDVPIAFIIGDDPVRLGLAASFSRPGGNASGISLLTAALGAKRLELICEMVPAARTLGLLVNPANPNRESHVREVEGAAAAAQRQLVVVAAATLDDIESAYRSAAGKVQALIVQNDPFFDAVRDRLISLAAEHAVPAIYHIREFAAQGGLMSFGPSLLWGYRELGVQTGRMLRGDDPATLPIVRPTRFELTVNLKTAGKLGLQMPGAILALADEIVE